MNRFTLLLPVLRGGEALRRTLDSLFQQTMGEYRLFCCTNGRDVEHGLPCDDSRLAVVHDEFRNLAAMKYHVFRRRRAEFLAEIPEGIRLDREALERLVQAFGEHPDAGAFFGDYLERPRIEQTGQVPVPDPADVSPTEPTETSGPGDGFGESGRIVTRLYPGDLTERVDLGPVVAYRHAAWLDAGGYDPAFNTAQEYDLRLRMQDHWEFQHLDYPLCSIFPEAGRDAVARSLGASRVFSPGEGPQGGFSYLFYGPAEEMEFETAFKNYLRWRGAFLDYLPETVKPAALDGPVVSVLIPFYNRERFIGKAVDSVLAGSFQDFEILCIDNTSTDDGAEVVRDRARRDPRVRLIRSDRNVIAHALNLGLKEARGRYIAQLDSDDEYTPETLAVAVGYLEAEPHCALAISYYELMEEDGSPIEDFGVIKHLEFDPNNHLRVDGAGAVRVWHRSVIEELGGFDEEHYGDFAEDYDLVAKVAERWEVGRIHQVLYRYRRHPGNTDVLRSPEMKIANKTRIRHQAIARRRMLNGYLD